MGSLLLVVVTNPSIAPLFHWRWESFQVWFTWNEGLKGKLMWWARTGFPWASGLLFSGNPSAPRVKPSPRSEHAEVVVVGVVLLHQHHDVIDAGETVSASGPVRKRKRPGFAHAPTVAVPPAAGALSGGNAR